MKRSNCQLTAERVPIFSFFFKWLWFANFWIFFNSMLFVQNFAEKKIFKTLCSNYRIRSFKETSTSFQCFYSVQWSSCLDFLGEELSLCLYKLSESFARTMYILFDNFLGLVFLKPFKRVKFELPFLGLFFFFKWLWFANFFLFQGCFLFRILRGTSWSLLLSI